MKVRKKLLSLILAGAMVFGLTACGAQSDGAQESASGSAAVSQQASGEKIVNVGVTNTLESLNPLLLNGGEINKYATGLMFLPLMELDADLNFEGMLADSITTEDNKNFIVHIDEAAVWSDGTPVTADDVVYTALRLASPVINNTAMMYYVFEGVNDAGFVEKGAESVEGIQKVDDKTVRFTTKSEMPLTTFISTYARYLLTLPKHVIEQYSEEELSTADWFNHPDVVSGPFIVTDYESIEALENVNVVYGSPVTNQSVFIQTANVPDARVRQAMLYAINREQILNELLDGHGEVIDGFLSSASPFFDETIKPVPYDPEKAKSLLEDAGWDGTQTLRFYINSGDSTFVNAASIIAAQWAAVGIKAEIQTVDFATLMAVSGSEDYDVLAVQYTYAPVDPYPDMSWLLGGAGSWTGYGNDEVNEALKKSQLTDDAAETKELYSVVNRKVQEDVPMFSAYVISAQAAVNKRVSGAEPTVYGFFNDVHNWDVQ